MSCVPVPFAGLLLVNDEGNYVRLEAAALVRNDRTQHYVNFELRTDRQLQRFGTPDDFRWDGSGSLWLRLERRGNQILGAVTQEPGHWTYLNPKATEWPQNLELGVAAINASSRPLRGQFADLKVLTTEDTATDPSAE